MIATSFLAVADNDAGGHINNRAPVIVEFVTETEEQNEGEDGVLLGSVKDQNGEADIASLRIALENPPRGATAVDSLASLADLPTTEPAGYTDGWKVWDSVDGDGVLHYKYLYHYLNDIPGNYNWRLTVADEADEDRDELIVDVLQRITIFDDPVLGDGELDVGAAWGHWEALPGATDVQSENYLKVENSGRSAQQQFVVDFTAAEGLLVKSFVGGVDAAEEIEIEGNIQFAFWEGGANSNPNQGTFTYMETDADGGHTFEFTGRNKAIYIRYQLPALPEVLSEQDYETSYTVTPL